MTTVRANHGPAAAGGAAAERFPVALEYALDGDLRYLAHHDELRLLARALARAGWPVAYTRGFNPRPRLRVPLPRSVGVAADSQWALADLHEPRPAAELHAALAAALPAGCTLQRVLAPGPRATPHARRVRYTLALAPELAAAVGPRIAGLLACETLPVQRDYGPGRARRPVDIRPYIETIELDGAELRLSLRCVAQRTARPSELLTELGLPPEAGLSGLRRGEIQWDIELAGPETGPATHERT